MHQASVGFHCPDCTKTGRQKVYQGFDAMRVRPIVTQVLIGLNVAVFLAGLLMPGPRNNMGSNGRALFDYGLVAKYLDVGVGEGQWWRMITSGFMHDGILHLGMNMYMLWILGRIMEPGSGRSRLVAVYVTALLTGSLGALVLSPGQLTVGASGAIFGLMGAIVAAHRAQGISLRNSPLLPVLALNLVITFGFAGEISVGGHVGGLAGGALAGWLLFDLARNPKVPKWLPFAACAAISVGCLVAGTVFASGWTPA